MIILPAIDLFEGKVVRLARGDYSQMTVYSDDPVAVACRLKENGAIAAHIVDLEGARDGTPANFDIIKRIISESGLKIEVGGGIRTADVIEQYMYAGAYRIILGTVAVSEPGFLREMVLSYGSAIAVSVDIRDGLAAIKGWTEVSSRDALDFCRLVEDLGVQTLICTDISKDGLLGGANLDLYHTLRKKMSISLIASGGISSLTEIAALSALGMDGAIIGKALYTGGVKLEEAIAVARRKDQEERRVKDRRVRERRSDK